MPFGNKDLVLGGLISTDGILTASGYFIDSTSIDIFIVATRGKDGVTRI